MDYVNGEELKEIQREAFEKKFREAIAHQMKLYSRWRRIWPPKAQKHRIKAFLYRKDMEYWLSWRSEKY